LADCDVAVTQAGRGKNQLAGGCLQWRRQHCQEKGKYSRENGRRGEASQAGLGEFHNETTGLPALGSRG
ncbi:MAG: hypothetical protein WB510_07680, partial [Candidatus Sulfotelmatobacter sp.]